MLFNKKLGSDILILLFFILLPFIFFSNLFWPHIKLLYTPDYNRSDVFDIEYTLKSYLGDSLKNRKLPLWSNIINSGTPLLAQGQIGTFYLPNLILFYFLPSHLAFNLSLILCFIMVGWGTYLVSRNLKLSKTASLFTGTVFAFSGFFIFHMGHLVMMQAAAIFPWLFLNLLIFEKTGKIKNLLFFSLLLSQQIFTGHFQYVFISLFGQAGYLFLKSIGSGKIKLKLFAAFTGAVLLGILISSCQLLPTLELSRISNRQGGVDFDRVTEFPFEYKTILSFLNPFIFGNPSLGSYNEKGVFWENTFYFGIIPLLFFLAGFAFKFKEKKVFLILIFISYLLVLGKFSPIYFIFTIFPFNLFRVPSRFLFLGVFFAILLAGFVFDKIKRKVPYSNFLSWIIIFICLTDLFFVNQRNRPLVFEPKNILSLPESLNYVPKNGRFWTITSVQDEIWYNNFRKGWINPMPFLALRNASYPYSNLNWRIESINILADLIPYNPYLFFNLLEKASPSENDKVVLLPAAQKMIKMAGLTNIISGYEISPLPPELNFLKQINEAKNVPPIYVYKIEKPVEKIRFVDRLIMGDTINDLGLTLLNKDFNPETQAVVAKNKLGNLPTEYASGKRELKVQGKSGSFDMESFGSEDNFLVLAYNNYPGWKAYLDSSPVKIYPVNFTQMGVFVPKGAHNIKLIFRPDSLKWGMILSFTGLIILFLGLFLSLNKNSKNPGL